MTGHFPLDDKDYLSFRDLIQDRTGITIGENRREVLARTLKEGLKHTKCADLNEYLSCLESSRTDSDLWDSLVKELTIGETYFFRHLEQIETLRRNILPDLIARHWTDRTLCLWSAGCASGEEPYTLAILLRKLLPDIERWKILILATDINRQALARATAGHYREWSFRETDPALRRNYFTQEGDNFIIDPSIQKMVTFSYLNLAEDSYPSALINTSRLDLILCRNVTIYLPRHVIRDIADRFYHCMAPGGWLMVGPSETHLEIYSKFNTLVFYGSIVYQKIDGVSTASSASYISQKGSYDNTGYNATQKQNGPGTLTQSVPRDMPPSLLPKVKSPAVLQKESATMSTLRPSPDSNIFPTAKPLIKKKDSLPESDIDFYEDGEVFMKQRSYEKARKCFLAYLALNPGSVSAQYRMACLEANAGRLSEALDWAEQALKNDPLLSEVHYILAVIYREQGKSEEAINCLKKVIYLNPDFILAHFSLFHLFERNGKKDAAERHRALAIHLALKLSPDTVLAGSENLTAGRLLSMAQIDIKARGPQLRGSI